MFGSTSQLHFAHPRRPRPEGLRERRVIELVVLIAMLGISDLLMTLTYMGSTGMIEANPIAVHLVRLTGSAASIIIFKALTMLIGLAPLYRLRRHLQAELAAWTVLLIFVGVCVAWMIYAAEMSRIDPPVFNDPSRRGPGWVRFGG
jgi:uncharacterized membrane protein